jgi:hypothetical protein
VAAGDTTDTHNAGRHQRGPRVHPRQPRGRGDLP